MVKRNGAPGEVPVDRHHVPVGQHGHPLGPVALRVLAQKPAYVGFRAAHSAGEQREQCDADLHGGGG
jgi:hypothetical protein